MTTLSRRMVGVVGITGIAIILAVAVATERIITGIDSSVTYEPTSLSRDAIETIYITTVQSRNGHQKQLDAATDEDEIRYLSFHVKQQTEAIQRMRESHPWLPK